MQTNIYKIAAVPQKQLPHPKNDGAPRTCSSAVGGYSPGFNIGLVPFTGAPFDGTSEAIPAAADTGFEAALVPGRDSPTLPVAVAGVFTSVLVPE